MNEVVVHVILLSFRQATFLSSLVLLKSKLKAITNGEYGINLIQ